LHLRQETLIAHAVGPVPEAALELVVAKLRHQVARRKDRRVRSKHRAR
jgi:ribosome-associated translation inhibitor RaiA